MKSKLLLFYQKLLNTYYYNQNHDEETSKRYAYVAIRNIIGVAIFMFSMVIFVVVTCAFNINVNLKGNRLTAYLFMAILIIWYIYFSKKTLKPLFDGIELKKEKPPKDNFFLIAVVLFALFAGSMFVFARLIGIYLCG